MRLRVARKVWREAEAVAVTGGMAAIIWKPTTIARAKSTCMRQVRRQLAALREEADALLFRMTGRRL